MAQREFANQKALIGYAEQNGLVYMWTFPVRQRLVSAAFVERQRRLGPDQYEIVAVHTSHGVRQAMFFSKAILQAEWAANAPQRESMAIKREEWQAKEQNNSVCPTMRLAKQWRESGRDRGP